MHITITDLPKELIETVLCNLSVEQALKCRRVCHAFEKCIRNHSGEIRYIQNCVEKKLIESERIKPKLNGYLMAKKVTFFGGVFLLSMLPLIIWLDTHSRADSLSIVNKGWFAPLVALSIAPILIGVVVMLHQINPLEEDRLRESIGMIDRDIKVLKTYSLNGRG
jgi:hypothetical protein